MSCCSLHTLTVLQAKELQEPEAVDGLAGGGFGKKVRLTASVEADTSDLNVCCSFTLFQCCK
jgi:hypothetical protein